MEHKRYNPAGGSWVANEIITLESENKRYNLKRGRRFKDITHILINRDWMIDENEPEPKTEYGLVTLWTPLSLSLTHELYLDFSLTLKDFKEYFEPVKVEVKKWTDWKLLSAFCDKKLSTSDTEEQNCKNSCICNSPCSFFSNEYPYDEIIWRTNGKKVQVRMKDIMSSASCAPMDNFSLEKGLCLALIRLSYKCEIKDLEEDIQKIKKSQEKSTDLFIQHICQIKKGGKGNVYSFEL